MRYLSVCSGIEAATVAWHDLGWQPVAFSEIEPFPSAVLAHHYPNVPNLGDMTKFKEWDIGTIDLLVGGTPCQSFSVAGLRKGLEDPRGNLALTYVGILDKFRPKWFVWENVPGVLSSGSGRDFGSFLGAVGQIGYGFAYRVLDAQYFGVAQRRRRVFVVGCLGDWRSAAEVLFESHSLSGNPAPSRETGQKVAGTIAARFGISRNNHEECVAYVAPTVTGGAPFSRTGNERVECDAIIPWPADIAPTLNAHFGEKMGLENQHINGGGGCSSVAKCLITKTRLDAETETLIPIIGGHFSCDPIALAENTIGRQPQNGGNGDGFTVGGPMYTLNATGVHGVAQPTFALDEYNQSGHKEVCYPLRTAMGDGIPKVNVTQPIGLDEEQNAVVDGFGTLKARTAGGGFEGSVMQTNMAVRRLTPTECERLQGFPDSYTNIPWRKKEESPDGPRYKALGNSMAVPVMAWIGKRIVNAS
jgi:DNA (cytosine-5)-methyltransferase 1